MNYWLSVLVICLANYIYQWLSIGQQNYLLATDRSFMQFIACLYIYIFFYRKLKNKKEN